VDNDNIEAEWVDMAGTHDYKGESLKHDFMINIVPEFLVLAINIERVFYPEEAPEDFPDVLQHINT
jgi:hypothetical protein